ncbi:MAG: hypothetical protein ABW042_03335, partial [Phenylobacterium sp.]
MKMRSTLLGLAIAAAGALLIAGQAAAQCCAPPPPPCCVPPPPPPQPPCCTPGHNVNIPGVNVFVAPQVVVNASASAQVNAAAAARGASDSVVFVGGGSTG